MTNRMENEVTNYSIDNIDSNFVDNTSAHIEAVPFNETSNRAATSIPDYLQKTYYWSYINPRNVKWLDREAVVKTILWWQHNKLRTAAFSEIEKGSSVIQVATVYGNFCKDLARHIGDDGQLKLIDVAPIQVSNTQLKLAEFPLAEVCLADASTFKDKSYDVVLCYFLLHEIPDDYKRKVMSNLLKHLKPNGKLVIVDYHKPHWAHPIKPITSIVFDTLEPFAKTLWRQSIQDLTEKPELYDWQHTTYFGGLFQKVVVQHKP